MQLFSPLRYTTETKRVSSLHRRKAAVSPAAADVKTR
ncbi:unknown protein [Cronobacter turicensis z3032]|jgi:hypothetical protein|uniref:Uncharacterized protein n=1 Tax=Cronobacter turicensis (strain DSM 18703 / CCUG 55852 / LMG 23827 / z3032) TaxID=693216 RepID=C9XVK3_CROTZ|nr:unknown protein [Cronobacter turicensis z3032]